MKPPLYRSVRKPKGQGSERREEILAAALRLVGAHGVGVVSTRQIAEAAGLSQPALYAYFATKDEILGTLYERSFVALTARLRTALDRAASVDRLATAGRVYVEFGLANPDAYRVAFMIERPSGPKKSARGQGIGFGAFAILRDEVRSHCERLGGEEFDPNTMAQSYWASVHGLVSLLIARPKFPWVDRTALIETHLALLCRSVEAIGR
jgi:AcrR family transcriptional regulator